MCTFLWTQEGLDEGHLHPVRITSHSTGLDMLCASCTNDTSLQLSDEGKGRGRRTQIRYASARAPHKNGYHLAGCCSATASFWAAQSSPCMDILESCITAAGLFSAALNSGQGKQQPEVRISQPCSPARLSLIISALPFVPCSQIASARLFPAYEWCCQLVLAQPGGEASSKHLASEQRQPLT